MDLETKIKELEKQLELKKAYLDVNVSFGRGNKISAEVREEITAKIKEFCAKLAESTSEPENTSTSSSSFSDQEVEVLKELVAKLSKAAPKPKHSVTGEPESRMTSMVSQAIQTMKAQNRAQLLMLDNVDRSIRDKIEPNSIVRVVGKRDDSMLLVEAPNGLRFHVPVDDLEFNLE